MNFGPHDLGRVPLLSHLEPPELARLWARTRPARFSRSEILRMQGQRADRLLVLLAGTVTAVCVTPAGGRRHLAYLRGPCVLDKTAVLDARGHTATFVADTACAVRTLPRQEFLRLIDEDAVARGHVLRHLADDLRRSQRRLVEATSLPAQARVAAWLLEAGAAPGAIVALPGSQEALGHLLGLSRVSVNRALKHLERRGAVRVEHGGIRLLSPETLEDR
ncbi:Crp/Fnr family transcriptional regulator [Sphaerisporangium flaviroseum]|uniref:Crp/Fnr family transcriptional regulator n=1 Tax=Sphaerisporangium flaviroseum TaxID=509199 RepID=A0ABP7IT60_9ACTN